MAEKLKSNDAKPVKKNDNGKRQADEPQKIATLELQYSGI